MLAKQIFIKSNIKGHFKLRSGKYSNEYFDKYQFESSPQLLKAIAQEAIKLIPSSIDFIAGLELGGVPLATMISHYSSIPTLFIRKNAKDYGTCKYAEGADIKDRETGGREKLSELGLILYSIFTKSEIDQVAKGFSLAASTCRYSI